jgi:alpha-L-rhamnosidase
MPVPRAATPTPPRFEHHTDTGPVLGIGTATPRLSWTVPTADPGWQQTGYELEVLRGAGVGGSGGLKSEAPTTEHGDPRQPSGRPPVNQAGMERARVESPHQVLVPWPSAPLASREAATLRVRLRGSSQGSDQEGADGWSPWSDPATVEAGLLAASDWTARFISPRELGKLDMPAPVLRGRIELPAGEIAKARLYVTAHGVYQAALNAQRVGDELLAPGWTSYDHRLPYQTHDVTALVQAGENVLEVLLGNGWYRGRLGWGGRRALYGDRLALLAQLEVTLADGSVRVLATDESWTAHEGGILADDLYDGQRTDLRHPGQRLWISPAASPRFQIALKQGDPPRAGGSLGWAASTAVEVIDASLERLVAPEGPPVRVTGVIPAVRVFSSPSGATLVDFGQNLVGWVRLRVRGANPGDEVIVRHAEVLEQGELGTRPLRSAKATDSYLLAGEPEEVLEPSLTFHGFRYVEVSGVPGLRAEDVEAMVVGSDLRRTGWFTCSDPRLERLHENVLWSMRGNFLSVPTDCPQRDERMGWTGDIQVFSPTAMFLFDSAGFLSSWLQDLAADQFPDGSVPFVIPDVLSRVRAPAEGDGTSPPASPAAAAWGDAATLVPWVLYQRSDDAGVLARQFPSMRAWVDHVATLAGPDHLWRGGFQFGDWVDPTAPPDNPFGAKADPDVIATAYFARSSEVVAMAAEVLGDAATAERYAALAASVREAFAREYVTTAGRVRSDAQTVYALALAWGLLPSAEQREGAGRRLAELVHESGFRISTGFVGTPLVTDALVAAGEAEAAYKLLLQTGCPSWLYPVEMGATTIWERWDALLPDGGLNPGEMLSFNHYALGAVADWLHRTVAGLAPAGPGYREILVRPLPGDGLTSASARHHTPYGEAAVAWQRTDGTFTLRVEVPVGTTATVHLPAEPAPLQVGHGRHEWARSL